MLQEMKGREAISRNNKEREYRKDREKITHLQKKYLSPIYYFPTVSILQDT